MTTEPNDLRRSILRRLREVLEADAAVTNNLLDVLTWYLDQMCSRGLETLRVESLPADPLINYCLHTLKKTAENDIRNSINLVAARNELF
uniref:Uncharacterized protein n=1 Tax=Tanacetum cinerariifolium TaxID=118510 RepID=A0A6L2LBP8_TANCI|nr:hypothetical protein [Tanacetum cinerariifolium]